MRAARSIAVLVGICWFAAGCTNLSTSKKRASDVFATIIRSFADQPEGDPAMKIYVEPRGEGSSISVDVQADVVTAVEDVADVRFIDARSEALEENDAGELVVTSCSSSSYAHMAVPRRRVCSFSICVMRSLPCGARVSSTR